MHRGWIKLWRRFQDHPFWRERRRFSKAEAWLDLLMQANHAPRDVQMGYRMYHIGRGELLRPMRQLAAQWGWSRSATTRFFVYLKAHGMAVVKTDNKTSHVTICRYNDFQQIADHKEDQPAGHEEGHKGDTSGPQEGHGRTYKNGKHERMEEEQPPLPPVDDSEYKGVATRPPIDDLGYMGTAARPRQWQDKMVELYRTVWEKPGYAGRTGTLNDMVARATEYEPRDPDAVATVIRKSRELFDNGDGFYGLNCDLGTLMREGMFAKIFEAEDEVMRDAKQTERVFNEVVAEEQEKERAAQEKEKDHAD